MSNLSNLKRLFYTAALAISGAFGGVGMVWVIAGAMASQMPKAHGDVFLVATIPRLIVGAAIGFGCGLAFAIFLLKSRPNFAQKSVEQKYVGQGGLWLIFSGLVMFPTFLLMPLIELMERKFRFGNTQFACILFGFPVSFCVIGLLLYKRIPRRLIMPLGFLGWLLTFIFSCWYGWFGMGPPGNHHP